MNEKVVYYWQPSESLQNFLLDKKNVELVEKAAALTTKVKIKLLRKKLSDAAEQTEKS